MNLCKRGGVKMRERRTFLLEWSRWNRKLARLNCTIVVFFWNPNQYGKRWHPAALGEDAVTFSPLNQTIHSKSISCIHITDGIYICTIWGLWLITRFTLKTILLHFSNASRFSGAIYWAKIIWKPPGGRKYRKYFFCVSNLMTAKNANNFKWRGKWGRPVGKCLMCRRANGIAPFSKWVSFTIFLHIFVFLWYYSAWNVIQKKFSFLSLLFLSGFVYFLPYDVCLFSVFVFCNFYCFLFFSWQIFTVYRHSLCVHHTHSVTQFFSILCARWYDTENVVGKYAAI